MYWTVSYSSGAIMQHIDLERMELDDLWMPHVELAEILAVRISAEKERLDGRLHQLRSGRPAPPAAPERRPYPPVVPKFRNPLEPSQT